ncbi:MAG: PBECR2 nuclease fold domain-containing protein [Desulfovibrionaceae bacterium]
MPSFTAPVQTTGTPFAEAIAFHKNKLKLPTRHWTDIWQAEHSKGFVVSGAVKDDLLTDFHEAIRKAVEDGTTLEEFRADFDAIVARHGWTYNGSRGWRSKLIYETNLRQAHMAGRWEQAQRLKARRPFLMYVALQHGDRRPEHQAWHGTVLPVDHPWWDTHHPINGFGCKCSTRSLSQRDLDRRGLTVSEAPQVEYEDVTVRTPDGPRVERVPKGVQPGFAYNPGKAATGRQLADKEVQAFKDSGGWKKWRALTPGNPASAGRPAQVAVDAVKAKTGPKAKDAAAMARQIKTAIGGEEAVFTLADGSPLLVNAESLAAHLPLDRSPFIPFLPELIADPFEIWLSFEEHEATGRVVLRKRLVKVVRTRGDKGLVLVANAARGVLTGWTYIPMSRLRDVNAARVGKLLWGRD